MSALIGTPPWNGTANESATEDTPGISFIRFNDRDVVRHRLVQSIILAYESFNADGPTPPPETDGNHRD